MTKLFVFIFTVTAISVVTLLTILFSNHSLPLSFPEVTGVFWRKPSLKCVWVPLKTPLSLFIRLSLDVTRRPVVRTRVDRARPVWCHLLEEKTQVIQKRCVQRVPCVGVFHLIVFMKRRRSGVQTCLLTGSNCAC